MKDFYDKLFARASAHHTIEEVELISEAIFLLEQGMNRIQPLSFTKDELESYFKILEHIIDYRSHQYLRETGCKIPDTMVWTSIQKAFNELKDETIEEIKGEIRRQLFR